MRTLGRKVTLALALVVTLGTLGAALVGAPAVAHASSGTGGSGGGGTTQAIYNAKLQDRTALSAHEQLDTDGCTWTAISLMAGEQVSRTLPGPTTTFGPVVVASISRWNACTDTTLFIGVGELRDVALDWGNATSQVTLPATLVLPVYDRTTLSSAGGGGDGGSETPVFYATLTNVVWTATGPAIHSVGNSLFHTRGMTSVQHFTGRSAPATVSGTITIGSYAVMSGTDLVHAEIDDVQSGSLHVART